MPDLSGQSFGRYHIIAPLGEGGMAIVYKAFDTRLEREVAIKVIRIRAIPPDQLERLLIRFEREAKRMAKFAHPNIVPVIDYGEYEGSPYLVMPYLMGGTLKARANKSMPYTEAARILAPVARALEYAHRLDTIHRDVKPANILLTEDGQPILTDFGVAKILDLDAGNTLTGTGVGVGTPKYMAPEQWMNQISPQTDIYALGVVFYELVTGRFPYDADTPAAIMMKQLTEPLPSPRRFIADLPQEVENMLFKALAREPQDRYADMGAFAAVLERLASQIPQVLPQAGEEHENTGFDTVPKLPLMPSAQPQKSAVQTVSTTSLDDQLPEAVSGQPLPVYSDLDQIPTPSPDEPLEPFQTTSASPEKSSNTVARWIVAGVIGFGILAILGVVIVINLLNLPSIPEAQPNEIATQTAVMVNLLVGETLTALIVEPSETPIPRDTITPQNTRTPLPLPTKEPAAGETRVSEKDGMVSLYIPAGEFLMGSTQSDADAAYKVCGSTCNKKWYDAEVPQHSVYLDGYWMDETEVTNAMFTKYIQSSGYKTEAEKQGLGNVYNLAKFTWEEIKGADWQHPRGPGSSISGKGKHPVVQVNWNDAREYCEWAGGRLPSEAEWERAARGTDGRMYPWGNTIPTCALANYRGKLIGIDYCVRDTAEVGTYPSGVSPLGIQDMAGNVFEWVNDWYGNDYYQKSPYKNPPGASSGDGRVVRGGSWNITSGGIRSAARLWFNPSYRLDFFGFRCVRLP